jgi:hypothetical protein
MELQTLTSQVLWVNANSFMYRVHYTRIICPVVLVVESDMEQRLARRLAQRLLLAAAENPSDPF